MLLINSHAGEDICMYDEDGEDEDSMVEDDEMSGEEYYSYAKQARHDEPS